LPLKFCTVYRLTIDEWGFGIETNLVHYRRETFFFQWVTDERLVAVALEITTKIEPGASYISNPDGSLTRIITPKKSRVWNRLLNSHSIGDLHDLDAHEYA
jgi:hypothetical protein